MKDKKCRENIMTLILFLRKKKILDEKDMKELLEELFGKPEEIRLLDCYKI